MFERQYLEALARGDKRTQHQIERYNSPYFLGYSERKELEARIVFGNDAVDYLRDYPHYKK